jgi:hypothetical protein
VRVVSNDDYQEPIVRVTMMLADSAQVADGRLFILGGGVNEIGPGAQPIAIAVLVDVPWDRANIAHEWRFELLDEDGGPVLFDDQPISVTGNFEAGRAAGLPAGTPITVPMAINFGALPIQPGNRYEWRLAVNGTAEPEWSLPFRVRPVAPPAHG